jgi:hypothetical protein
MNDTRVASLEFERWQQGRRVEGSGRVVSVLRGVTAVSGVVVCSPVDPPTGGGDPETIGQLIAQVLATGGGRWQRVVSLPRWGAAIPIPAGTVEVSLELPLQQSADVSFQPARAGTAWQRDDADLGPGATLNVEPPPYATRMLIAVIEGSAQLLSVITPAVVAPASIDWPASSGTITAGINGARVAVAWECTA